MTRTVLLAALGCLLVSAAHAELDIVKVPVACGTPAEVGALLEPQMPQARTIGHGSDFVRLMTSPTGYWAMIATMSPTNVCIVASGRGWKSVDPGTVEAY